jgi:hypothetical protein
LKSDPYETVGADIALIEKAVSFELWNMFLKSSFLYFSDKSMANNRLYPMSWLFVTASLVLLLITLLKYPSTTKI